MADDKVPLGIRQNNPGNIERRKGVHWEGQAPKQTGRFMTYTTPPYGIRAIARVLVTYADARKARDGSAIDTVSEVIDRWAPPFENNAKSYAAHVSKILGVRPDDALRIKDPLVMYDLADGIIRHENGYNPYTHAQMVKGLQLAGIEMPLPPLRASRTIKGGQVATVAGTATTVAGVAGTIAPALPVLDWARDNLGTLLVVLGVVTLTSVGYMIWARIDDRAKGLR